jgi:SAM-dependent methyltransferase
LSDPAATTSGDPTLRLSDRVAEYERYRPGYPPALIQHLRERGALPLSAVVADVGSGTGISAELFLDAGCKVFAIEPSAAMREAAFANAQSLDFDALLGRLLSSSYAPREGQPAYRPMVEALRALFDRHADNGRVAMLYDTHLYLGRLDT